MKSKADRDLAQVAAQCPAIAPECVALVWVGLRADGSYAHGVVCPPSQLPLLVRIVGAVLQKLVKATKAKMH